MTMTISGNGTITGLTSAEGIVSAGTVAFFGATSAPTGYLKANGDAVSRTTYAALYAAIGTTYGTGNGSTTFNLPDLRGYFPRGLDDGRGVDTGRTIGSTQADETKAHTHNYNNVNVNYPSLGNPDGAGYTTITAISSTTAIASTSTGGTESRPKNIALLACIKY